MIAVVDYSLGNLFSLTSSLSFLGLENKITNSAEEIRLADKIILPGVGAFQDAIEKLGSTGLIPVLKEEVLKGKPLLGICLGMQLLFDKSFEYGEHQGLGLISGEVCPIEADLKTSKKVPHMGWNSLNFKKDCELLKYINEGDYVYFVHSFYAKNCEESIVTTSDYDVSIPGVVQMGNVYGTQFHPEKSGKIGLSILKAFSEI